MIIGLNITLDQFSEIIAEKFGHPVSFIYLFKE